MSATKSKCLGNDSARLSSDISRPDSRSGSGANDTTKDLAPSSAPASVCQSSSSEEKKLEGGGVDVNLDGSSLLIASRRVSSSEADLEAAELAPQDDEKGAVTVSEEAPEDPPDPNLVTWSGPDDPKNPKNWADSRKWAVVFVVSTFTLMSPMSSAMIAPSLTAIGEELDIPEGFQQVIALSIFILAYAVGPLLWGPLSELYGRVIVLQLTNLIYMFFNLGCGLAQTQGQLVAFRFMSGLGGSAPLAIGGGLLTDLFTPEQRGKAMSIYALIPLLGPAIGPIAGGFITEGASWRWVFYATTIADGLVQASGFFFLRETYAPVLLARRRDILIEETGNNALRTPYDKEDDDDPNHHQHHHHHHHLTRKEKGKLLLKRLQIAFSRPFRLLATQPIIMFISLYMMYLYGLMYIVLSSFPTLWSRPPPLGYGMSVGVGGLNYISLGLGCFLGAQIAARAQDKIYAALKRRHGTATGRPEYRVPIMVPSALMVPVGLLIYGWTAERKTHWIGPDIGTVIFSAGIIFGHGAVQGYVVDAYPRYAASGVAAVTVLRSLAGFGFPLFAPAMYNGLGMGWGNTLMALVGIVIGWPGPPLLWKYGPALRRRSTFASGG